MTSVRDERRMTIFSHSDDIFHNRNVRIYFLADENCVDDKTLSEIIFYVWVFFSFQISTIWHSFFCVAYAWENVEFGIVSKFISIYRSCA